MSQQACSIPASLLASPHALCPVYMQLAVDVGIMVQSINRISYALVLWPCDSSKTTCQPGARCSNLVDASTVNLFAIDLTHG